MSEAQTEDLRGNAIQQLIDIYRSPVVGASKESIARRSSAARDLELGDKKGNLFADNLFCSTKYKLQMWEIKDPTDQQVWDRAIERTRDLDGRIIRLDNDAARLVLRKPLFEKLKQLFI